MRSSLPFRAPVGHGPEFRILRPPALASHKQRSRKPSNEETAHTVGTRYSPAGDTMAVHPAARLPSKFRRPRHAQILQSVAAAWSCPNRSRLGWLEIHRLELRAKGRAALHCCRNVSRSSARSTAKPLRDSSSRKRRRLGFRWAESFRRDSVVNEKFQGAAFTSFQISLYLARRGTSCQKMMRFW